MAKLARIRRGDRIQFLVALNCMRMPGLRVLKYLRPRVWGMESSKASCFTLVMLACWNGPLKVG